MIYFIQPVKGGPIKIGTTIRLSERLKQLASEYGDELCVLAVVDGGHDEEKTLHRRFDHLRRVGEWFEPGDDLIGFIVGHAHEWDGSDDKSLGHARIELEDADYERLKRVSKFNGLSVAAYIRQAVLKQIRRDEAEREGE